MLVWHGGPPPHVGWWNASVRRDPNAWRWWNGANWSVSFSPTDVVDDRTYIRPASPAVARYVRWTHAWPENARVPRVDPNAAAELAERLTAAADELDRLRAHIAVLERTQYDTQADASRWRFTRYNRLQYFEPTRHWRMTSADGHVICEGRAASYEAAVDAAMQVTRERAKLRATKP